MPDSAPNGYNGQKCGAYVTGGLVGGHPTKAGQSGSRRVFFSAGGHKNYGNWARNVKVTHCGSFFVYALPSVAGCVFRYCATN